MKMTESEISTLERLKNVFRDIFDDEELEINNNTTALDIDGWDSLAHIRLILSIEKAFNIRFSAGEISELKNIKDMVDLVCRKKSAA